MEVDDDVVVENEMEDHDVEDACVRGDEEDCDPYIVRDFVDERHMKM